MIGIKDEKENVVYNRNTMNIERPLKFRPAYIDGCIFFSFIHYALQTKDLIVYALSDERETHATIHEYAQDEEMIGDLDEPVGGGIFDARTGEYLRGSIHYGKVSDDILEVIDRKLPDIVTCNR